MDPTATLADALTWLATQHRDEAIEALRNLADWLERDGFFPLVDQACEAY